MLAARHRQWISLAKCQVVSVPGLKKGTKRLVSGRT